MPFVHKTPDEVDMSCRNWDLGEILAQKYLNFVENFILCPAIRCVDITFNSNPRINLLYLDWTVNKSDVYLLPGVGEEDIEV